MQRRNRELWLALAAILLFTPLYLAFTSGSSFTPGSPPTSGPAGLPRPSSAPGHWVGVTGFGLMLMTETLYSLRKRSRQARWGRTSHWLSFHIFTGITGPYLVLLHTAGNLRGLAGIVTALTVIIVASGFIGRYLYTAIPRSPTGAELDGAALAARRLLAVWHSIHIPIGMALFTAAFIHILAALYFVTFGK